MQEISVWRKEYLVHHTTLEVVELGGGAFGVSCLSPD